MSKIPHSSNKSIHDALRVLAREIESEDGAANVAIADAADRISELGTESEQLRRENAALREQLLQKTQQLDPEYAYLKTRMERVDGVLDRLSLKNAELLSNLMAAESEIILLREERDGLRTENAALKKQLTDTTDRFFSVSSENAALRTERNRYRVTLEDIAEAAGIWASDKARAALERKEAQP